MMATSPSYGGRQISKGSVQAAFRISLVLSCKRRERSADSMQHRRVASPHTFSLGTLETRGVQLPILQNPDLLLSGESRVINDLVWATKYVRWIIQSSLHIDLGHLDLHPDARHQACIIERFPASRER